jgi:hypothetical protein
MPFDLDVPWALKKAGWKVKIFDKEALEPPHVTILRGPDKWRYGLREGRLLVPPGGSPKDIPPGVWNAIEGNLDQLKAAWDRMFPTNVVGD